MARKIPYGGGRDLLIGATVSVVAKKGLRGLTFRAVAERVGVDNSLVAHHFGNRDTLLLSALEWAVGHSVEITGSFDMASAERFADAFIKSIEGHAELQAFQYEMILESRRHPIFGELVAQLYERYHDVAADSLRSFGITDALSATARHLSASMDGIVLQHISGVDPSTLRAALEDIWMSLSARRVTG